MGAARSLDPRIVDGGFALALTLWTLADPGGVGLGQALVRLAMAAAIAWRRRAPLAVLAVEVAGVALIPKDLDWPQGAAVLIAGYSAALYSDQQLAVGALLIFAAAWLLAFGGGVQVPNGLVPFLILAPTWLAGTAMRRREQRAEASEARADRLELEQEESLRAERARIARELHDVVTHAVSVMVLQTGAARQIMPQDERRSQALLESVESSGRSALEELRRLLGLLSDDDGDAPLAPQPSVSDIPSLIEHVRQAGVAVDLRVEGEPRSISGGVSVAAYRIVQEALTNVLRHADSSPTQVVLRWTGRALELEIVDQGPRHNGLAPDAPPGRGLVGMRERAAMYGGTLDAHPGPDRGYVVRARIPLGSGAR
jgi:signal transduction histidine kinase